MVMKQFDKYLRIYGHENAMEYWIECNVVPPHSSAKESHLNKYMVHNG